MNGISASFGWKPYDDAVNPNKMMGSKMNAYLNADFSRTGVTREVTSRRA